MLKVVILSLVASISATDRPSLRPTVLVNDTTLRVSKIINGVDANEGDYPYLASLNYVGDGHACGASILTPDWVLTAAHCCLTGYPLEVYVGSIYLSRGGQTYPIRQYIINGDYDPNQHWKNDICLINVGNSIQYSDKVQPVPLPPKDLNIPSGEPLTIPGWGAISNEPGTPGPDRLQVLFNDNALTNSECSQVTGVDIYDGQICTLAGKDKAVCSGDSGGPLSRNGVQVGLTSWGYIPCGIGMPDVFTRVSFYIDWISQVLGNDFKDIKFAKPEDFLLQSENTV